MEDPYKDENVEEVTEFAGFTIAIENPQGSVRSWVDGSGERGSTHMRHPYGYIVGTKGLDGDSVDVFLGPDENAPKVFIVTQHKKLEGGDFSGVDEQKIMLGFHTSVEAKTAYLQHYDNARFFKDMTEMGLEEFRTKVTKKKGKLLKSAFVLEKSQLNTNIGSAKMSDMFYLDDLSKSFEYALPETEDRSEERSVDKSIDILRSVTASCETDLKKKTTKACAESEETEEEDTPSGMSKALSASMIAGISKRARLDAAHKAGMAAGFKHRGQITVEPAVLDLRLGNDRPVPLHEGLPVRSRVVPTPFEVPAKPAQAQDEHAARPSGNEEATPLWRRG